jgi:hypothetical protein
MTKKITHMIDNFMIDIEERTQEDILKSINDAGYTIGHNSLTMLLNGNCFQAGMFEIIDVRFDTKKTMETKQQHHHQPSPPPTVIITEEQKEIPVSAATTTIARTTVSVPVVKQTSIKQEVVEQKVAREVIKQVAKAPKQKSSKVIPKETSGQPESVLVGTKNAKMFELLARQEGASREDIMTEFGWTPSCFASIIYTVPKSKGYAIFAEKTMEGKLRYHLYFIGGAGKVLPEQVRYRERKGQQQQPQQQKTKINSPSQSQQPVESLRGETVETKTTGNPTRRSSDNKDNAVVASMQTNIVAMAEKMAQHFHPR